ncbi:MAG: hypothetical protein C5S47_07385 [Candidatus Methanogasteraceae archaeon]|nr:MAG: hypothetical protein C5S47_07385 [ANME-2 cluster archaeon]
MGIPFIIVVIGAGISAISAVMGFYCYGAKSAEIVRGVIAPFIWWFLCAGAFYAISIFSGGVGSFKRVLEFTGYGVIPQIPSAILNALLLPALLPLLASDPSQFTMYVIAIISPLFSLCSVAIWVFAVKHSRNMSTNDAPATVVGSVVAGWLLMWGMMGIMADMVN